ncbi:hypothetical protein DYB38_004890 [Aphanomyces astaci]|uniref:Myosin-like protein n=1 Tax=Aphanomyces astaci TaxID=112090 RepID=A0A397C8B8_APHAT|nr:hypothetical protein DYB38_004890 [Aphanomyces astaci]
MQRRQSRSEKETRSGARFKLAAAHKRIPSPTHIWTAMETGARVWISSSEDQWQAGVIDDCRDDDDANSAVRVRLDEDGTHVCTSAANVYLRNDVDDFVDVPNLISLQYLHEPELLHAVCNRYEQNVIYTYVGEILLSFNPFQRLNLYTPAHIQAYAASTVPATDSDTSSRSLPPHVFAIAAIAYQSLCDDRMNQSILVSGESGAGKTENTKLLMQYLTAVGATPAHPTSPTPHVASPSSGRRSKKRSAGATSTAASSHDIQTQILQTNPILEAFGNARTVRNDNSSRFGKFIELQFGRHHTIVGAKLSVYLLEKIRVSHQSDNERNFHIFYELCAGADDDLAAHLSLLDAEDFVLLNESGCFTRRDGVDDAAQFHETSQAFTDMGILADEQRSIYGIVAALLHLGNVALDGETCGASNMEHASIRPDSLHHLDTAAALLGVSSVELTCALVTRHVTTTKDKIMVKLSSGQATEAKQSLTQSLFGGLFEWIVARLSSVIRHDAESANSIGILDIFGFENLVMNGFEQLCINYANERLQAQFNDLVFAKEQRMYQAEGIEWKYIDYPDNAPCLRLLEDKPTGIWSLLDEEGMLPKGSNEGWIAKLYSQYLDEAATTLMIADDKQPPLSRRQSCPEQRKVSAAGKLPLFASSSQRAECQFVIGHFAGRVVYDKDMYVQKNQDALPVEALELCRSSSNAIVQGLLLPPSQSQLKQGGRTRKSPPTRQASSLRSASVSSQFKGQLDDLLQVVGRTQARYIRCIKPNDVSTPRTVNKARVVQQLRSGGVLEAVRIARAGYAVRMEHSSFMDAFGLFMRRSSSTKKKKPEELKGMCEQTVAAIMLQLYASSDDGKGIVDIATAVVKGRQSTKMDRRAFQDACGAVGFQLGNSKVFFRKDVYNDVRRFRRHIRTKYATLLQQYVRGFVARRHAKARREAVAVLQTQVRAWLAHRSAVRTLQTWTRRFLAVTRYRRLRAATDVLQKWGRHVLWTARLYRRVQTRMSHHKHVLIASSNSSSPPPSTPHHKAESFITKDEMADVAALTRQNQLLQQELDLLRIQQPNAAIATPMQVHGQVPVPPSPAAAFAQASHNGQTWELPQGVATSFYQQQQQHPSCPPVVVVPAGLVTELEFAHHEIVTLSQQLLMTQIKYSNMLMDYNEHLGGYDADKPMDDAFAMVEALDIPCPTSLECAQEQLRALLRKLHVAKEKLKHLETNMGHHHRQTSHHGDAGMLVGSAMMFSASSKPHRGDSIDAVEFVPRRSSEIWRPYFDDNYNNVPGTSSGRLPPIHDLNDCCMMPNHSVEYMQKVDELQRQLDMLRGVMHKAMVPARVPQTASTVSSSSRSSIGSLADELRHRGAASGGGYNATRLTYYVKDVTTWARDYKCFECKAEFGLFTRRHHCRLCSQSFCHEHSNRRARLVGVGSEDEDEPVRVCDVCFVDICNETRRQEQNMRQRYMGGGGGGYPLD